MIAWILKMLLKAFKPLAKIAIFDAIFESIFGTTEEDTTAAEELSSEELSSVEG